LPGEYSTYVLCGAGLRPDFFCYNSAMRFLVCPYCSGAFKHAVSLQHESEDGIKTYYHSWFSCRACSRRFYSLMVEYLASESGDYTVNLVPEEVWKRDVKKAKRFRRKPLSPGSEGYEFAAFISYGEYIFSDYS